VKASSGIRRWLVSDRARRQDGHRWQRADRRHGNPGLGKVVVDKATKNIRGQKLEAINKGSIDKLVGMGL
jgi:hypothetical protein